MGVAIRRASGLLLVPQPLLPARSGINGVSNALKRFFAQYPPPDYPLIPRPCGADLICVKVQGRRFGHGAAQDERMIFSSSFYRLPFRLRPGADPPCRKPATRLKTPDPTHAKHDHAKAKDNQDEPHENPVHDYP